MSLQCEYAMSKFVMTNFETSYRPDIGIHTQIQSVWEPSFPLPGILKCVMMIDSGPFKTPSVDTAWLWTLMFSSSTFQPPSLCSNKYWGGEQFPHPLGITREQMCFNITNHSTTIEQISSGLNDEVKWEDDASKINLYLPFSEVRQPILSLNQQKSDIIWQSSAQN